MHRIPKGKGSKISGSLEPKSLKKGAAFAWPLSNERLHTLRNLAKEPVELGKFSESEFFVEFIALSMILSQIPLDSLTTDQKEQLSALLLIPFELRHLDGHTETRNLYFQCCAMKLTDEIEHLLQFIFDFNVKEDFKFSKLSQKIDHNNDLLALVSSYQKHFALTLIRGGLVLDPSQNRELMSKVIGTRQYEVLEALLARKVPLEQSHFEASTLALFLIGLEKFNPAMMRTIVTSSALQRVYQDMTSDQMNFLLLSILSSSAYDVLGAILRLNVLYAQRFILFYFLSLHSFWNGMDEKLQVIFDEIALRVVDSKAENWKHFMVLYVNATQYRFDFISRLKSCYHNEYGSVITMMDKNMCPYLIQQFFSFLKKYTSVPLEETTSVMAGGAFTKSGQKKLAEYKAIVEEGLPGSDEKLQEIRMGLKQELLKLLKTNPEVIKFFLDQKILFRRESGKLYFVDSNSCEDLLMDCIQDSSISDDVIEELIANGASINRVFVMAIKEKWENLDRFLNFTDIYSVIVDYVDENSEVGIQKSLVMLKIFRKLEHSEKGGFLYDVVAHLKKKGAKSNMDFLPVFFQFEKENSGEIWKNACQKAVKEQNYHVLKELVNHIPIESQQQFLNQLMFFVCAQKKLIANQLKFVCEQNFSDPKTPLKVDINARNEEGKTLIDIGYEKNNPNLIFYCFEKKIRPELIAEELKSTYSKAYLFYYGSTKDSLMKPHSLESDSVLSSSSARDFSLSEDSEMSLSIMSLSDKPFSESSFPVSSFSASSLSGESVLSEEKPSVKKKLKTRPSTPSESTLGLPIKIEKEKKLSIELKDKKGEILVIPHDDENLVKLDEGFYAYWHEEKIQRSAGKNFHETLENLHNVFLEARMVREVLGYNGIKRINKDLFEVKHCPSKSRIFGEPYEEVLDTDEKKSRFLVFHTFSRKGLH
jgi:hypothetical protein